MEIGRLFASVDVPDAGQLHLFFTAELLGGYSPGEESLETAMYDFDAIPWDDIAFQSGYFALKKYVEDAGQNNGVHTHAVRRRRG